MPGLLLILDCARVSRRMKSDLTTLVGQDGLLGVEVAQGVDTAGSLQVLGVTS